MEEKKKLSYEELENLAHQLSEQAKQLYARLQQSELTNVYKRLDYLFKVLEFETCFDSKFVEKCSDEIKEIMTVQESEDNSNE